MPLIAMSSVAGADIKLYIYIRTYPILDMYVIVHESNRSEGNES
jgi:hypothetical protein